MKKERKKTKTHVELLISKLHFFQPDNWNTKASKQNNLLQSALTMGYRKSYIADNDNGFQLNGKEYGHVNYRFIYQRQGRC